MLLDVEMFAMLIRGVFEKMERAGRGSYMLYLLAVCRGYVKEVEDGVDQ